MRMLKRNIIGLNLHLKATDHGQYAMDFLNNIGNIRNPDFLAETIG